MKCRIIEKEGFTIVGQGIRVSTNNEENFNTIPKFWETCHREGTFDHLMKHMGPLGVMGVCTDYNESAEEFTYMIAIEEPEKKLSLELTSRTIAGHTWAIFEAVGPMPKAIQETWQYIFSDWMPSSEYKHANGPELEIYYPGDPQAADYQSEVWVPVVKK